MTLWAMSKAGEPLPNVPRATRSSIADDRSTSIWLALIFFAAPVWLMWRCRPRTSIVRLHNAPGTLSPALADRAGVPVRSPGTNRDGGFDRRVFVHGGLIPGVAAP